MAAECMRNVKQRTALLQAAIELKAANPAEALTVLALCGRCGISRATFYRSFSGVHDIPSWYQTYSAEMFLHEIGLTLTCEQGHRSSLEFFSYAQPLFQGLVHSWNPDYSQASVLNHIDAMRKAIVAHGVAVGKREEYEIAGVAHMSHQMVSRWINNGMDLSLDGLVDVIVDQYPTRLRKLFDKPLNPTSPVILMNRVLNGESNEKNLKPGS